MYAVTFDLVLNSSNDTVYIDPKEPSWELYDRFDSLSDEAHKVMKRVWEDRIFTTYSFQSEIGMVSIGLTVDLQAAK